MNAFQRLLRLNQKIDPDLLHKRRQNLKSFKAKMDLERTPSERFADFLTDVFGTVWFFILNIVVFLVWITWNSGVISGLPIFDPNPYGLLTMIVSLEAIFLAIIVLISQNRAAKIADLREEVDLQINTLAEQEITRMINILDQIHDRLGLPATDDEELQRMKKKKDIDAIESELMEESRYHIRSKS